MEQTIHLTNSPLWFPIIKPPKATSKAHQSSWFRFSKSVSYKPGALRDATNVLLSVIEIKQAEQLGPWTLLRKITEFSRSRFLISCVLINNTTCVYSVHFKLRENLKAETNGCKSKPWEANASSFRPLWILGLYSIIFFFWQYMAICYGHSVAVKHRQSSSHALRDFQERANQRKVCS